MFIKQGDGKILDVFSEKEVDESIENSDDELNESEKILSKKISKKVKELNNN